MARNMYGATSADFTLTSGGRVVPGAVLTIWSARTGGTQITDLLDADSVATTTVTSDSTGAVVYYGPNNDKSVHWADSGQGSRIAIRPVDITGDPPALSIGTVGTGAAAASLTGTSEAPVLNLVLPSAGANGVDTAAIQSKAVTAAKIADDTITATQIAANAVGASELADNAVDAAAIADGAVTPAKLATTGRFTFPTGAANGYGFASGAVHLSGTGSPEGVVTAAPGSTWLQTDATTDVKGWIRWVKATGTGNTGWQVGPEADTGWRSLDATALGVDTGKLTLTKCLLRRQGNRVSLSFYGTKVGTGGGTWATVPTGFRPYDADAKYVMLVDFTSKTTGGIVNVQTAGTVNIDSAGLTAGRAYIVSLDYEATSTWPSSLPGSAA